MTLDPAPSSTLPTRTSRLPLVICLFLIPLVLSTTIRIEYFNSLAGEPLSTESGQKLRVGIPSEDYWRHVDGHKPDNPAWYTRPLTPAETAAMNADFARYAAARKLRDVLSLGCLQYLLAPTLLIFSLPLLRRPSPFHRLLGLLALLTALAAAFFMFYRGYIGAVID